MNQVASPTSQGLSSRRRGGTNTKEATTEDQALNMIAREAEARLAAKRAARAEARSIRMKEIERKQKEADEDGVTSDDNEPPDDNMYLKKVGRMSSPTLSTSFDIADTVAPSMQVTNDAQILQLKDAVKEGEVKYKKAMVNAAQLDNERQALQYQVEVLKDIIEELQQRIENTDDELHHKCKEYNKLTREHKNTTSELNKCLFLLEERERVLDENGLNIDGTVKEGYEPPQSMTQCSNCNASLNDEKDSMDHSERGSLLAEIASLRSEIEDLKKTSNSEHSRRELESMKIDRVELEQSFADVSNEAAVIREDALHIGLYVNNNEKNDDFELIGDGSQQIRRFEDQSFEKSTSSITSSMVTDGTTSMESSLPLELSVDNLPRSTVPKDDYDFVQVEDSRKSANINVDSYTSLEYQHSRNTSTSSTAESNININKYLFDDHDENVNEDIDFNTGFSVDKYFATSEPDIHTEETYMDDNLIRREEVNEVQTRGTITNVQSDYDTIDTEEVIGQSQFAFEENRNSPYEDVQVESAVIRPVPSDGMVIIEESKTNEQVSYNEKSFDSSDIGLIKYPVTVTTDMFCEEPVLQTDLDSDFDPPTTLLSIRYGIETDLPSDQEIELVLAGSTKVDSMNSAGVDVTKAVDPVHSEIDFQVSVSPPVQKKVLETNSFQANMNGTVEQAVLDTSSSSTVVSSDNSMNTAFVTSSDEHPIMKREESISESDKMAIRKDFEDLYNQIARETDEPARKNTWVATVEYQPVEAPEIKVVDTAPPLETNTSEVSLPEPKERKKKKKKKKQDKSDDGHATGNTQEQVQDTVVPTDPLLLGFAPDTDPPRRNSDKSVERTPRPKSDIPKQFLDASAELIDNSFSDASDRSDDEGEIGEDGRKKSSKRSKKEGCKSQ